MLVTGATGFIGSHLCRRLRGMDIPVRALVRHADVALPTGVEPAIVRSLEEHDGLARAVDGMRSVVHMAARVHVMHEVADDPLAEFRRVNVQGTANLLAAAERAGVRRFVYLSTIKVHGEQRDAPYRESEPLCPQDPYSVSKLEAERLLVGSQGPTDWVIIRPPLVYGAGVGGNFIRLLDLALVARRLPLPLGSIKNRRSLVFVGNLADAIIYLLDCPQASRKPFLVADGEDLSSSELIVRIARAGGWSPRLFPFPSAVLGAGAHLLGRRDQADRMFGSLTADTAELRATGWRPPFTVDEGLEATVRWWKSGSPGRFE